MKEREGSQGLPDDPSRRRVLVSLVGVSGTVLVGCTADQLGTAPAMLVSPQQERQLGLETWERILKEEPRSSDSALQRRLETIGARVVEASGTREPNWEFAVLKSRQVNAFAVPGGKVAFYEGIFPMFENDDQLATVMGHEVGHINARHGAQRIGAATAAQVGLQAVSAALQAGNIAYANQIAGLLGAGVQYGVILPYSRAHEYEADRLGVDYMARAGYAPPQAVAFWQNMTTASQGQKPPEFMSTHPSDANRIAQLQALMTAAMQTYEQNRA